MPQVKGFKGWRYNSAQISDLTKVFAPPYDVISKKQQEELYRRHPANVIRLELGKEMSTDNAADNKYSRAKRLFEEWMNTGVLRQDRDECLYVCEQFYKIDGRAERRIGFLAAMQIDENAVLKHENTLATPKKDRMALLKEVRTNLSPIFGLFEDKKGSIQKILTQVVKKKPEIDVTIDNVRHRVFALSDTKQVKKISALLKAKPMFIADGHHRFEVACQFKKWIQSQKPTPYKGSEGWRYVMTYFSDVLHNPFKIYPTHRLIKVPSSMRNPIELLLKCGDIQKMGSLKEVLSNLQKTRDEEKKSPYKFGIFSKKHGFYLLKVNSALVKKTLKSVVDELDVAVLHNTLIAPLFKIKKIEKSESIDFTRDADEAYEKIKDGSFDLAFFLRPTSLKEMLDVSKKGLKMPQKSTYFYPKLLTGVVFHRFE